MTEIVLPTGQGEVYLEHLEDFARQITELGDQEIRDKVLDDFAQWVKTEWVQESIREYKAELRSSRQE